MPFPFSEFRLEVEGLPVSSTFFCTWTRIWLPVDISFEEACNESAAFHTIELEPSCGGLDMSDDFVKAVKQLTILLVSRVPNNSAWNDSRERRLSMRVCQENQWTYILRYVDNTHICIDTTKGNGEHAVQIRGRENDKRDQITHGEDSGKKTCMNCTADKSVENCIRPAEPSSRTREDDGESS